MKKHVIVVQNVDLSEDLAVSVFLKHMLKVFSNYNDLKVEVITAKQKGEFSVKNIKIHQTGVGLYSIKDNLKFSIQVYKELKEILIEDLETFIAPMREKRKEFEKDIPKALIILKEGSERAKVIARQKMQEVKEKIGVSVY